MNVMRMNMPKPKLIFDGTCPICVNYVKMLRKKIPSDFIDYESSGGNLKDFKYISTHNVEYSGKEAIDIMASEFPQIKQYFWMLPESYRINALQAVYNVSSVVRSVIKSVGGCNCGKNK